MNTKVIGAFAVLIGGILIFLAIACSVSSGITERIDAWAVSLFRSTGSTSALVGPVWLPEVFRDITSLGSGPVILIVSILILAYLRLQKNFTALGLIIFAAGGGTLLNILLKEFFARPRPDAALHLVSVTSLSFPSGHSMMSAVFYLSAAVLLAREHNSRNAKYFIMFTALVVTFLVGLSRMYLGVHYLTDVAAGWSLGAAWAAFCWLGAAFVERKKRNDAR